MICGTVSGASGMVIAIIAIAGFLTLAWMMIATPTTFISFSNRYDAWLSTKIKFVKFILRPLLWLQSSLERLGIAPGVVRVWGAVVGLLGLFLLVLLLISVFNPCA